MGYKRFNFAEEDRVRAPASVWLPRALVTGLILGITGAAHILLGFKFF